MYKGFGLFATAAADAERKIPLRHNSNELASHGDSEAQHVVVLPHGDLLMEAGETNKGD